jgi:hypothetical protein
MQMRAAIICVVLAACVASGSLLFAREPEGPAAVTAEQLIAQALAGEAGKEANAQPYTLHLPARHGAALAHPPRCA